MKRWLSVILFLAALLAGCSGATVTEWYERTPKRATSIGPGRYEYYRVTPMPSGGLRIERIEGGEQQ